MHSSCFEEPGMALGSEHGFRRPLGRATGLIQAPNVSLSVWLILRARYWLPEGAGVGDGALEMLGRS